MASEELVKKFGNKVRVRVMGLWRVRNNILLINHKNLNSENELWLPPGGGVDFGLNISKSLKKEYLEETGLDVSVGEFLFVLEFISASFHAIELFFKIDIVRGEMQLGRDPEMNNNQILQGLEFMNLDEIKSKGKGRYHRIFDEVNSVDELFAKRGFLNL